MTHVLWKTAAQSLGVDAVEEIEQIEQIEYINETELCNEARRLPRRLQAARGKKHGVETGYYHGNAFALGMLAANAAQQTSEPVVAVLFRDIDGTRGASPALPKQKLKSVRDGFAAAGFQFGVPMLPKPKSEVWLMAMFTERRRDCSGLEGLPGNDQSPNAPKRQLAARMGGELSSAQWCDRIHRLAADDEGWARLRTLPSYTEFETDLQDVLARVRHR